MRVGNRAVGDPPRRAGPLFPSRMTRCGGFPAVFRSDSFIAPQANSKEVDREVDQQTIPHRGSSQLPQTKAAATQPARIRDIEETSNVPRRDDIRKILLIGSGPIVIGQACEFDYSGTQACKALREEGYEVVLVNSNPATIMTDPNTAHRTYIEPLTWEIVEKIIAKERPDALLPTLGGQTGLNVAMDLERHGVLAKYNCLLIGANAAVIAKAEEREKFKVAMEKIGLEVCRGETVKTIEHARRVMADVGLPCVVRPSFTMGGSGSAIAYNRDEFDNLVRSGLDQSPVTEVLIEESFIGWNEHEIEVMRDLDDNVVTIC